MNNNSIALPKVDGIYDIQPMIEPGLNKLEIISLAVAIIFLLALGVYFLWFYFFSAKAIAKRKIKKLQFQYLQNNINTHDAVYKMCLILRSGLNVNHLSENTPLPNSRKSNKKQWGCFTKEISLLRYKNNTDSPVDITPLFNESLFWLNKWP